MSQNLSWHTFSLLLMIIYIKLFNNARFTVAEFEIRCRYRGILLQTQYLYHQYRACLKIKIWNIGHRLVKLYIVILLKFFIISHVYRKHQLFTPCTSCISYVFDKPDDIKWVLTIVFQLIVWFLIIEGNICL